MKQTIWEKAVKLLYEGKFEFTGEGNNRIFYKINNIMMEIRINPSGWQFLCTCKNCSIHADKDSFCKYKAAMIGYFLRKEGF